MPDIIALQRSLTGERRGIGETYMDEARSLGAYLMYYWPLSYAQARFSLSASLSTLPHGGTGTLPDDDGPLRVLDLGAGPGPAGIAAADLLLQGTPGPRNLELVAMDRSALALDIAGNLVRNGPDAERIRYRPVPLWDGNAPEARSLPEGPFDVIVAGHLFNEIAFGDPDRLARRAALAEEAIARLRGDGLFLIMEPALLQTSREAIELRDLLVERGHRLLWPCPWKGACHAIERANGSCHMEFHWSPPRHLRRIAERTGLDRRVLKTAAFIFAGKRNAPIPPPPIPPGTGAVAEPAQGGGPTTPRYRVISEGMLNKAGRTRLVLCGDDGRATLSAKRGEGFPAERAFFSLTRGSLVSLARPAVRESGFALGQDTVLSPIPEGPGVDSR